MVWKTATARWMSTKAKAGADAPSSCVTVGTIGRGSGSAETQELTSIHLLASGATGGVGLR